jgi:hypothetical protein
MVNLKAPLRDLRKKVNFFDESNVSSRCGERISPLPSLFLRHMLAGADYAITAVQELVGHNRINNMICRRVSLKFDRWSY